MRRVLIFGSVVVFAFGCASSDPSAQTQPDAGETSVPSPGRSTLAVDPTSGVIADGVDQAVISVTVRDGSSEPVVGATVRISITGSGNTLSTPAPTDSQGRTQAVLTSTVAESKTVTATIGSTTLAQQPSVLFVAGEGSRLSFQVQPGAIVAGATVSPAVQIAVEDAWGNTVTSPEVQITATLSSNPGGGTLLGTTAVETVNGVATFSDLSLKVAGTGYALKASSGDLSAVSDSFDVSAGPANQLAFATEPSDAQNDAALAPIQVAVEDAYGNLIDQDTRQVTLSLDGNPSSGTLFGTSQVAASAGVATFSGLSIDRTGSGYTLRATAAEITDGVSTPFDVTPAPITGTKVDHYVTSSGVVDQASALDGLTIAAVVPLSDGGFDIYPGAGTETGTFSIPGVPTVPYYLQLGTDYWDGVTRTWDVGTYVQGRPDTVEAGPGTFLEVDLDGLASWNPQQDELDIYGPNTSTRWSVADGYGQDPSVIPDAGATIWQARLDYSDFWSTDLLDGSEGDSLYFWQMVQAPTGAPDAGLSYRSLSRLYVAPQLTVPDGVVSSVSGTMSSGTQESLALTVDFPAFESLIQQTANGVELDGARFIVLQHPFSSHNFFDTTAPRLMDMEISETGLPEQTLDFDYGLLDPSWSTFGEFEAWSFKTYDAVLPDGGTMSGAMPVALLSVRPPDDFTGGPVTPRLGPVQQLMIDGRDGFADESGIGLTPLVSWQPPALGSASFYVVSVYHLKNGVFPYLAGIQTWQTQVRIPPGILQTGETYAFTVAAFDEPGMDPTRPYQLLSYPVEYAGTLSGKLTP